MKTALICGITGQDGSYLASLLIDKGYRVVGTSRDAKSSNFSLLKQLGIFHHIETVSMMGNDFRKVLNVYKNYKPDEVYNLSGQSSVVLSFDQPLETMESIAGTTLNLLEAMRFIDRPIRFYNAGSGECFGDSLGVAADEHTPFSPQSPYAIAKCASHWMVNNYRSAYGLFACTGILFNHESPLRPSKFVTQKIIQSAADISKGKKDYLDLGNIDIQRDWGWAPEYVVAMWKMLNIEEPDDFVIATGKTVSLKYFIEKAFDYFSLDWKRFVRVNSSLLRPTDILIERANPKKANNILGWKHKLDVDDVIIKMCESV